MMLSLFIGTFALFVNMVHATTTMASFRHPTIDAETAIEHARHLEIDEFLSFFLVSHISEEQAWCITAVEGTKEFGDLLLQPCNFGGAPANQLWFPSMGSSETEGEGDFKIRSALDDTKCITVNHGKRIFASARNRLADCENGLNVFYYDGQIRVADDDSFCITNRGPRAHADDWIHVRPCMERKDFYWQPVPHIPYLVQLQSGGGCAQPREGSKRVFLDECNETLAWRLSFEEEDQDHALIHSPLDDTMCLRAGRGETVNSGRQMALVPCDNDDLLQQFLYDGYRIQLNAFFELDLCMVYRGINANIGEDPIIMKSCNEKQDPWDVIELSPFFT